MRRTSVLGLIPLVLTACSGDGEDRYVGQTSFESAPLDPPEAGGGLDNGAGAGGAGTTSPTNGAGTQGTPRTVQETDLYRLDGNRLYYLNSYRGLMVFDVTNPDHPALLGRSPIFGDPVDMVVNSGIATVVVGDWYGTLDNGTPFHGSVVRGLDATDPTNIKVLGDARIGGWVQDDRVVGNVIYAVSEDYGWTYGWNGTATSTPKVIVASVSFANNQVHEVSEVAFPGYSGIFNVTPYSIMLAHNGIDADTSQLLYLDISDPNGAIVKRGSTTVKGDIEGWGADNGRWNLDFADGVTAHVIAEGEYGDAAGYYLTTVDFSNPDAPSIESQLEIPAIGYGVAARFDTDRLYLSPSDGYTGDTTPFQVYDLTAPTAPKLAGTVTIPGTVWNILPAPGSRLFALGEDWNGSSGDTVSLKYLDVTNPSAPRLLSTTTFGQGWAWTPAEGTFKAFTMDATKGLVVLPFAGWDDTTYSYNNGLQLIEFTPSLSSTAGTAHTKGWVERGIFVGNRLVSLSDLSLAVVDYSDPMNPSTVTELTLARNVITAQPSTSTIAEISSDWWGNDVSSSQVRVLPLASAEETTDAGAVPTLDIRGVAPQVFTNGSLTYVVTSVQVQTQCPTDLSQQCAARAEQVEVLDLTGATPVVLGTVQLPVDPWGYYSWGWAGFYWWDWYWGDEVVQVGGDALAFRHWQPNYDAAGNFVSSDTVLDVVDLSTPSAPTLASVVIQPDRNAWWGNLKAVGDTLYTTHYEWVTHQNNGNSWVRYYIDSIDLSDRAHPRIGASTNVPGVLVGGDANDPSVVYTIDYRWNGQNLTNEFDALRLHGHTATLLSRIPLGGWVGETFIQGSQAYFTLQPWDDMSSGQEPNSQLHAIDLSDPGHPDDHVVTGNSGWGWLVDVVGDRALVTSGWGYGGLDIYQLAQGQTPQYRQTVRTTGWWLNGASRQDNTLYLSSGYWGVQRVDLQ